MRAIYAHGGVSGTAPQPVPLGSITDLEGTTAVDLVENAVKLLEDDPRLNAGYGAVLTIDGTLELDAGLACGRTGRVGAVAGVAVRHPLSLARRVMEETPHVLLAGEGAKSFGHDMEQLEGSTPEQHARWRSASAEDLRFGAPEHVDTVGAVALDPAGGLAAGSSTGGVFGKLTGRVGDAPIYGAGLYASELVAVVGTGVGEAFMRNLAAARVARHVEDGAHPQEACERVIRFLLDREKVAAGLLALDAYGRPGAAFAGASWPLSSSGEPLKPERIEDAHSSG